MPLESFYIHGLIDAPRQRAGFETVGPDAQGASLNSHCLSGAAHALALRKMSDKGGFWKICADIEVAKHSHIWKI